MQMAMLVQGLSSSGNELELLVERSMRIDWVHALGVARSTLETSDILRLLLTP